MFVALFSACVADSAPTADDPAWSAGPLEPELRFAVLADPHVTTATGANVDRLARAVDWINTHAADESLAFVLVLGDVAWGDGFPAARATLDTLVIPYVPINGDNEVQAEDEGTFAATFADQYATLGATFADWELAPQAVTDPVTGRDTSLQNLAFSVGGLRFVGLDWASRTLGGLVSEVGVLHDFDGGSLPFLRRQLSDLPAGPRESVVLFSHIPMHLVGFNTVDTATLTATIAPVGTHVWADLAGHYHSDGEEPQDAGYDVIVTDATWDDEVEVRVVSAARNEETYAWRTEIVVVEE